MALALVWTFPLVTVLSDHLLGDPGDNVTFVWSVWWMRTALARGLDVLSTPLLFAPWGVDLTLHTHIILPAFVGATLLGWLTPAAALNVTVIAAVALSGFCAYALAWRATGSRAGALLAGVIYAGSPFMAARLQGHFNLVHAWVLPLFVLVLLRWIGSGQRRWAAVTGVVLGLTIYVDYYFALFQLGMGLALLAFESRSWTFERIPPGPRARRAATAAAIGAGLAFAIAAAITLTGGFSFAAGGLRVSARNVFNPLQVAWLLMLAALVLALGPRLRRSSRQAFGFATVAHSTLIAGAACVVVAFPILWRAARLAAGGGYVTQEVFWRSGPQGVDAVALLAGSPFHPLWGGAVRSFFDVAGIDVIESAAWMGVVPLVLLTSVLRRHAADPTVVRWSTIGGLSLLWALGPHLMVLGHNTGLILPQALLRYLPVLSNARMPGRAMAVVYLAAAVLCAVALSRLSTRGSRAGLAAACAVFVALDYLPAPHPLTRLAPQGIYDVLRDRPEPGAVLELPLGFRDGFGTTGAFNERVLWGQMQHGRAIAGGFVARVPPSVKTAYQDDELFADLLALSAGEAPSARPNAGSAATQLRRKGIRFVVLDRPRAPAALLAYFEAHMPVSPLLAEGGLELFVVETPSTVPPAPVR